MSSFQANILAGFRDDQHPGNSSDDLGPLYINAKNICCICEGKTESLVVTTLYCRWKWQILIIYKDMKRNTKNKMVQLEPNRMYLKCMTVPEDNIMMSITRKANLENWRSFSTMTYRRIILYHDIWILVCVCVSVYIYIHINRFGVRYPWTQNTSMQLKNSKQEFNQNYHWNKKIQSY